MHGSYIFGQILNYHSLAVFVNFALLLVGFAGVLMVLSQANRSFRNNKGLADENNLTIVVMAISFFVTFLIFALSGYAIATLSNGQIVSAENARYISLLPLITVLAIVWVLKNYYAKHVALLCVLCIVLVGGIVTSYPAIKAAYISDTQKLEISPSRDSINQIITHLQNNDVQEASTDYWYGHTLRFWSKGTIGLAPVLSCDESMLTTANGTLFTKQSHNTALIIDRGERNYGFWQCTDDQLIQFYGVPSEQYEVPGAGPNPPVKVWIYKSAT